MSELRTKLLKNSTISHTNILKDSKIFNEKDVVSTPVPALNIALSGELDGGLSPGILQIAGPSKHFKSAFCLMIASSYLEKYEDSIILFYDSEFGTPESYFDSFNIDKNRVVHTPVTNIEELKHDIMKQLETITRGEKVCIIIDSIGNLASKKEVEDAIEGKSAADMTRAKQLKSFGRMITPHLTLKDIPVIIVNHTYKEMSMYPKDIVGGGTGLYLSADNIWIIGRQQDKEGTETVGYKFIINIEKSRHVQEKSKIPINLNFEGGISRWSGLFDIALDLGYIKEASKGWYTIDGTTKVRRSELEDSDVFWKDMLPKMKDDVRKTFKIATGKIMKFDEDNSV